MRAKITWTPLKEGGRKIVIPPGCVYRPDTQLNGQSFGLVVIVLPDKLTAKVETFTEYGRKIFAANNPKVLPMMEGARVVGELEFYDDEDIRDGL
jgi:hypothetical protein